MKSYVEWGPIAFWARYQSVGSEQFYCASLLSLEFYPFLFIEIIIVVIIVITIIVITLIFVISIIRNIITFYFVSIISKWFI